MRVYADSSFILRLVTGEADSPQVVAEYRRLKSPKLFFLSLHALEVRNAILQRAFHKRRSSSSEERRHVARERDAAFGRLESFLARGAFYDPLVRHYCSNIHVAPHELRSANMRDGNG